MPTKTQTNFKNQMKSYKKEASADKEKIFSYIENDMISDYYSIKPKRVYKRSVPAAAIILLIIIVGVRIYGFTTANVPNASIGITQAIRSKGSGDFSVRTTANKDLQGLHSYLNDINGLKLKQNNVISSYNKSVSDFNNDIITLKGFVLRIEELINQIGIINYEFEGIEVVDEMERYHRLFNEGIQLQSALFEAVLLKHKTGKSKYINDINEIGSKIDIINAEMKNEMITRFDELGIEYEINPQGVITYTIRY